MKLFPAALAGAAKLAASALLILYTAAAPAADKREEIAAKAKALKEPVTLKFWQTHNAEETATLKDLVADFQKEYPQIKVEMDTVAFAEAQNKFKTAAKAGNSPDVFRSEVAWTAELAELGYLTPLDDYLSDADKKAYLERPMETSTYKDETWALPQVTDCLALLYNVKMLKAAGVDTAPKTFDEFVEAGKKITKPDQKVYAFAYPASDSYFLLPYLWSFGGGLVNEKTREVLIDNEGSIKGLQFTLDLRTKDKIVPEQFDVANDYTNQLEDFKAGRQAMIFMGPWATANILSGSEFKDPANLGIADLPSGPAGTGSPVGGHGYALSSANRNPDLGFLLIDFLNKPTNQAKFTVKNNLMPTQKAAYELPEVKSNRLLQGFRHQLDTARTRPVIPEGAALFPPLTQAFQDALRGSKSAKDALQTVGAEYRKLMKK